MDEREITDEVDREVPVTEYVETDPDSMTHSREDIEAVAREVLAGHWSRGHRRRQRLEAAGFNADEVNAAVNNILKGL